MSINCDILYGYGIQIPTTPTKKQALALNDYIYDHKNILNELGFDKKLINHIQQKLQNPQKTVNESTLNELLEILTDMDEPMSYTTTPYDLAVAIFSHTHPGIHFQTDTEEIYEKIAYMVFADKKPWLYTTEEKNLTPKKLNALFQEFMNILNIKAKPRDISVTHVDCM